MRVKTMTCKACRDHYKGKRPSHFASDPKCAFPDGGPFTSDNWNCMTASLIRDIAESDHAEVLRSYGDDQTHVMLNLDDDGLALPSWEAAPDGEQPPYSLWLTWYKRRGSTMAMWLLGPEWAPRPPTEADALAIVGHYKVPAPKPATDEEIAATVDRWDKEFDEMVKSGAIKYLEF